MTPRAMTTRDRAYVVSTWGHEMREPGVARRERFAKVDAILDAGATVVVLAEGPTVHAWAAARGDEVLFVYVPFALRGHHLARRVVIALLGGYPDGVASQIRQRAIELAERAA